MYSGGSGSAVSLQKYNRSLLGKRKARKRDPILCIKSKKNKIDTKEVSSIELNILKRKIRTKAKHKKNRDLMITLICFGLAIIFIYGFYLFMQEHTLV